MPPPLLITGFEPFGKLSRNPTEEIVRLLSQSWLKSELVAEILPVTYSGADQRIKELLLEFKPRCWIGLGLDAGARAIKLEEVAVNIDEASIADNAGDFRRGQAIDPGGPEIYRSTLPLHQIAASLESKMPTVFSQNAGRFVCNHTFYRACAVVAKNSLNTKVGFIHLPWPSDWGEATLPYPFSFQTLVIATGLIIANSTDHSLPR